MDLSRSTVAVTGATGFLGRYLVRALLQRGAHVVAVVRNPDRVPALAAAGVELRKADLHDRAALARGFEGVDAVLSNAAVVSIGDHDRETILRTNVEGTRNVLLAMADAGVRRAVYTSTATVYKPRPDHLYLEDHELRSPDERGHRFNWYAISKAAAEREAWELSARHGIVLTTFRPHAIHGAFDEHGPTAWLRRMRGWPMAGWLAGTYFPSVYAGDLAEAACRMLERPVAAHRAYNIAGEPGAHTFWDILRAWKQAGGAAPPLMLPIPAPMTRRYAIDRAKQELDFTNRPLIDGLRDAMALEQAGAL